LQISTIDIDLLNWLHSHLIDHSVPVLQFISDTTSFVSIGSAVVMISVALVKKSKSLRMNFFSLVAVLVLVTLVSQGLKAVIDRDRPFTTYPHIEKLSTGGDSSFPSGHTMEAFALATALSVMFKRRWLTITFYGWAALVAYSRMALGVHYPSDVLAGLLFGTGLGWVVPWFFRRLIH